MPEFIQKYNVNSLYICMCLFVYNVWKSNYEYIYTILCKLYALDYMSCIILINIIGIYLCLKHLSFEINVSVKFVP